MTSMVLGDSKLESLTTSVNAPYRPSIMVQWWVLVHSGPVMLSAFIIATGSVWNQFEKQWFARVEHTLLALFAWCTLQILNDSFWIWEKCLTNVLFCNGSFFWVCALKAYANLYDMFFSIFQAFFLHSPFRLLFDSTDLRTCRLCCGEGGKTLDKGVGKIGLSELQLWNGQAPAPLCWIR